MVDLGVSGSGFGLVIGWSVFFAVPRQVDRGWPMVAVALGWFGWMAVLLLATRLPAPMLGAGILCGALGHLVLRRAAGAIRNGTAR